MKYEITSRNTKKMLAQSLKEAMKTKPFSKITVSEIVQNCGLNRKTFYYHFEDIYSLLKWTLEEEAIEVVKNFDFLTDYKEVITFVIDYIEKNDYILNCAYDSIGRDEMKRFFCNDFYDVTTAIIHRAEQECNVQLDTEYKQFLCQFYTEALAGMLIDWIKNKKERNSKQIVTYLSETVKASLLGILQRQKKNDSMF
ncbi:MAG: TetR/AcrR family transcriptional regulator C-terminal domain-containing protein [Lachnospiraceae bacterium]